MKTETEESLANDPLSALTPERRRIFCDAILRANDEYMQYAMSASSSLSHMETVDRTGILRGCLRGQLKKAFNDEFDVRFRRDNGIFMIVFDQKVLIHFKKLNGNSLLGTVPKTLQSAMVAPYQPLLPGFDLEDDVPLSNLDQIVGGYVKDDAGLIAAFYFNVQAAGLQLVAQSKLDLSPEVAQLLVDDRKQLSETTFTPKKTRADQDRKVVGDT